MSATRNNIERDIFAGGKIRKNWLAMVHNFVTTFDVIAGGQFIFDGRNAVLQCFGGTSFNGTAYTPGGVRYEDLTDSTKPWLKYDLATGVITEETGPPSEPWGANEVWRKKSDFTGAIYF